MIETTDVHAMQRGMTHHRMTKGDKEIELVTFSIELMMTAAYAQQLGDFVRQTLYTRNESIANAQLRSVVFDIDAKPQRIRVRMAPDQAEDSYVLAECRIGNIRVVRYKESGWKATFPVTCSPSSPMQAWQIADSKDKGRWYTFEQVKPDLFSISKDAVH